MGFAAFDIASCTESDCQLMRFELSLKRPLIAAIDGYCLVGGLELALSCDMRVTTENSTFGLAEVTRAIIPGAGGTQRLPRLIPRGIAMELLLCGTRVNAEQALRHGPINRVVPAGQNMAGAEELARAIAANGPLAVKAIKEAFVRGLDLTQEEGMRLETLLSRLIRDTEDAKEGPKAFAEKRPGVYKILGQAEVVEIGEPAPVSRDPKDDTFFATAKAAAADYMVSADDDLLDIKEYEGTKIVDAVSFMQVL